MVGKLEVGSRVKIASIGWLRGRKGEVKKLTDQMEYVLLDGGEAPPPLDVAAEHL